MLVEVEGDEEAHLAANIAWLETADPDDWHRVALEFNWSDYLYVLDWIVRQPHCDIATALTIFWKGEPACFMEEEGEDAEEPDGFGDLNKAICAYIAERVRAGGYTRSEICFTPDTWTKRNYVELVDMEKEMSQPNIRTHPDLIRNRGGREVEPDYAFSLRYPQQFHHSSYDPPSLDDDGDYELVVRPGADDMMAEVKRVERAAYDRLPDWLQQQPVGNIAPPEASANEDASARIRALRRSGGQMTLTGYERDFFTQSPDEPAPPAPARKTSKGAADASEIRGDVAALLGNLMVLGFASLYLKLHGRAGSISGMAVLGIVAIIGYLIYSTFASYRDLKAQEDAGRLDMSDLGFKVGVNGSFVLGAIIAYAAGGFLSAQLQSPLAAYGPILVGIVGLVAVLLLLALAAWSLAPLLMKRMAIR
jgi:hypothetical protein